MDYRIECLILSWVAIASFFGTEKLLKLLFKKQDRGSKTATKKSSNELTDKAGE